METWDNGNGGDWATMLLGGNATSPSECANNKKGKLLRFAFRRPQNDESLNKDPNIAGFLSD